jgi:hypothetical protein
MKKEFNPIWGLISGVFCIMSGLLILLTTRIDTYDRAIGVGIIVWLIGMLGGIVAGISYFKLTS